MFVYPDAARFAYLQSDLLHQGRGGAHTDRQQHHVGRDGFTTFQENGKPLFRALKMGDAFFQI